MSGGDNNSNGQNDGDISRREIDNFAQNAFKQSMQALNSTDFDKTTKVFGLVEVPTGIMSAIDAVYNVGTKFLSDVVRPKAQELVKKQLNKRFGLQGTALNHAAAASAIGIDVAMKSGKYFGSIWEAHTDRHKQFEKLAQTLAPVLDDMTGRHTVGALASITQAQNEVIFAHRRRVGKIASAKSTNSWIDLVVNSSPNLVMDSKEWLGMWQGKSLREMRIAKNQERAKALQNGTVSDHTPIGEFKNIIGMFTNGMSAQVATYFKRLTEHNLRKETQPYSALEMIIELERQVAGKPDARSFTLPKSFQSSKSGESCSLEEYIMRIIIQHQKDMVGINPDHTEIREALKDDVAAVAKPLAEAIRKGDMSTLELVHLVGEGRIIKNHGRSIAHPDEVMASIKRAAPKQATYTHVDPKTYWGKRVSFSPKDAKEALQPLEGEERQLFIALIPHGVREQIGVSEKESKEVDAAMVERYDRMIADAVLAIATKSDAELEKDGLAKKEILQFRKAEALIKKDGIKAVHAIKESPTNDNGIEHDIANLAVPQAQINGNKVYLSTMVAQGHAQFDALAQSATNDDAVVKAANDGGGVLGKDTKYTQKIMSKHAAGEHAAAANDHASHAERARESLKTGTHDHHYS